MQQLKMQILLPAFCAEVLGVPPLLAVAAAFAWLGKQTIEHRPFKLCQTTGAAHCEVLDALYRAKI